jgi:Putative addiction module component
MRMTRQQILAAAMKLPPEEQEMLCEDLFQRCGPPLTDEQIQEAKRRVEEVERGDVALIPFYEVLRHARYMLQNRREQQ